MRDDEHESTFGASMLEHEDAEPRNPTDNPTMGELISQRFSRRGLLKGALAVSAISATVGTLLVHPGLARRIFTHDRYITAESTLPPRHRALLGLRAAWLARSNYLWAHRVPAARQAGLTDAELRRAGLDYWDSVDLWRHPDWFAFRDAMDRSRCLYFSAKAERSFWHAPYRSNSCLVFGSESRGLPPSFLERHAERAVGIPMPGGGVRSLNLATAAGIALYEALRQIHHW